MIDSRNYQEKKVTLILCLYKHVNGQPHVCVLPMATHRDIVADYAYAKPAPPPLQKPDPGHGI
jgi:hypothetical protein